MNKIGRPVNFKLHSVSTNARISFLLNIKLPLKLTFSLGKRYRECAHAIVHKREQKHKDKWPEADPTIQFSINYTGMRWYCLTSSLNVPVKLRS